MPEANVGFPLSGQPDTGEQPAPAYFPVSLAKFTVMSLMSFGIYLIYWTYRNWSLERVQRAADLSPFWRTFFAPLWIYSLLTRIRQQARGTSLAPAWSPGLTAVAFIVLSVSYRLPDPYWLISLFSFVPFLPVQHTVNQLNAAVAPAASKNDQYTGKNILLIVAGVILLLLVIWGMLLPTEEPGFETWRVAL